MQENAVFQFDVFRLDCQNEQLWCEQDDLRLTLKAFAVLRYLVEHAMQLVTKEAVLEAVWPDTYVNETALAGCIHEIRQVLGDQAREPRFIETVHRRGYRFIVPVTTTAPLTTRQATETSAVSVPSAATSLPSNLVGREIEMAQLHQVWATVLSGHRQMVFVAGEAGIGKTSLIDAFTAELDATVGICIGQGQCIEQYGAGEPYLPLLDALGQLSRGSQRDRLIQVLYRYAPSWLIQMPGLLEPEHHSELHQRAGDTTRDRMLRELAEAVDVLTTDCPLVLVLEDLHWSDVSTLDWLAYIARQRQTARLLILGTYRPVDSIVRGHPLRELSQELQRHDQCAELNLPYLPEAAVEAYLTQRLGISRGVAELTPLLHQRTHGNPLFLVNIVNEVMRTEVLHIEATASELAAQIEAVVGVPESLRQLIEQQIDQTSPAEQMLLAVASVAGMTFAAATLAVGSEATAEEVEVQCDSLSRRGQFIEAVGTESWPDGTVAACYAFTHALYQEVLYDRVPPSRRARYHRQIGMRLEVGYRSQTADISVELAMHFERGRDSGRAVQHLQASGDHALRRSAHQEAITHLTKGLGMMAALPETPENLQLELNMQLALGTALIATKGYDAPEVEATYHRSQFLCNQLGDTSQLFSVIAGLDLYSLHAGQLQTANHLSMQLISLAKKRTDSAVIQAAHFARGQVLFYLGDLIPAQRHLAQGRALSVPDESRASPWPGGHPEVQCSLYEALILWVIGLPDQARDLMEEALDRARTQSHPLSLVVALAFAARLGAYCREFENVQELVSELVALSRFQSFAHWEARGSIWQGWLQAMSGVTESGLGLLRQGLEDYQSTGAELWRPYFLSLLAEASGAADQVIAGLDAVDEALAVVAQTGERYWEAELYRLRGELLLAHTGSQFPVTKGEAATTCFQQALKVARSQNAKSLELRVAISLTRLQIGQGQPQEALALLAPLYAGFTEGFETADLQDAKTLLEMLSASGIRGL